MTAVDDLSARAHRAREFIYGTITVLIAIAGWRTFLRNPAGGAMLVWWAQLAFNFSWSPVFFQSMITALSFISR